jgi:hypothetical protein
VEVEVEIEIERVTEALHEGDGTALAARKTPLPSRSAAERGEDRGDLREGAVVRDHVGRETCSAREREPLGAQRIERRVVASEETEDHREP